MKLLSALDHSSRLRRRGSFDGSQAIDLNDLVGLAARIERFGLATIEPATLATIARRANLAGLHPEVAALLTDTGAPTVVRTRAFGLAHRRLAAGKPAGNDPVRAAA